MIGLDKIGFTTFGNAIDWVNGSKVNMFFPLKKVEQELALDFSSIQKT